MERDAFEQMGSVYAAAAGQTKVKRTNRCKKGNICCNRRRKVL